MALAACQPYANTRFCASRQEHAPDRNNPLWATSTREGLSFN